MSLKYIELKQQNEKKTEPPEVVHREVQIYSTNLFIQNQYK